MLKVRRSAFIPPLVMPDLIRYPVRHPERSAAESKDLLKKHHEVIPQLKTKNHLPHELVLSEAEGIVNSK